MAKTPDTLTIYPAPTLPETSYLPGVSPDGTELPYEDAKAFLDAGLAVTSKGAKPDVPAEPTKEITK